MAMLKDGLDLDIDEWFPDLDEVLPLVRGVKTKNLKNRQEFAYDRFNKFYCRYVNIHNDYKFLFMKNEFYTQQNVDRILEYMYYAEKKVRRNVRMEQSMIMRTYLKKFYERRFECVRRMLNKKLKEREKELRQMSKGVITKPDTKSSTKSKGRTKSLEAKNDNIDVIIELT